MNIKLLVWYGLSLKLKRLLLTAGNKTCNVVNVYLTDEFVALWFPRWRFARRGVELVVEQREGLLARQGVAGEQRTVPDREFDLDVDAVSDAALDERRPQPVVDVVVSHVANHVRPPVYTLLEVRIALLYPLKQMHLPVIDNN